MKLYLNTVSPLLWSSLKTLMHIPELEAFRLVGGTSLSLQLGHRESGKVIRFIKDIYNLKGFILSILYFFQI